TGIDDGELAANLTIRVRDADVRVAVCADQLGDLDLEAALLGDLAERALLKGFVELEGATWQRPLPAVAPSQQQEPCSFIANRYGGGRADRVRGRRGRVVVIIDPKSARRLGEPRGESLVGVELLLVVTRGHLDGQDLGAGLRTLCVRRSRSDCVEIPGTKVVNLVRADLPVLSPPAQHVLVLSGQCVSVGTLGGAAVVRGDADLDARVGHMLELLRPGQFTSQVLPARRHQRRTHLIVLDHPESAHRLILSEEQRRSQRNSNRNPPGSSPRTTASSSRRSYE